MLPVGVCRFAANIPCMERSSLCDELPEDGLPSSFPRRGFPDAAQNALHQRFYLCMLLLSVYFPDSLKNPPVHTGGFVPIKTAYRVWTRALISVCTASMKLLAAAVILPFQITASR